MQVPGEFVSTVTVTGLDSKDEDLSSALAFCVKLKIATPINRKPKTDIITLCKIFIDDKLTEYNFLEFDYHTKKSKIKRYFYTKSVFFLADYVIPV